MVDCAVLTRHAIVLATVLSQELSISPVFRTWQVFVRCFDQHVLEQMGDTVGVGGVFKVTCVYAESERSILTRLIVNKHAFQIVLQNDHSIESLVCITGGLELSVV